MSASDVMALALNALGGRNGDASSTTHAAVSDGALIVRDQNRQPQDINILKNYGIGSQTHALIESGANLITDLIAGNGKVEKKLLEYFKRLKIETLKLLNREGENGAEIFFFTYRC